MLTALGDCPSCGEPELYRVGGDATRIRCRECGWASGGTMEERVEYTIDNNAILEDAAQYVKVKRQFLETERRQLLARLHEINEVLGYPALLTGKERRRQA